LPGKYWWNKNGFANSRGDEGKQNRVQPIPFRSTVDEMKQERSRWSAIFGDIQFWVPFAVLVLGLLILYLVQ
jgi:hypothetical protein